MSTINTNGINVNYPVPGVNNNSQGFRDNFTSIRTNLNTAASEITDLQNKVVVKSALANSTLNNDMANTLISNAAVRGFRSTTYNLGNALVGSVLIDASLGDVQYGTIAGNVVLTFGGWAPTGTQSNIQLQFNVSNANAVISFPSEVVFANNNFGVTTLENYANIANTPTVSIPYGVSAVDYRLSTVDCGSSIIIEPYNRPRITTQVQQRTPAPTGFLGDVAGTVAVDANYIFVCTASYDSTTVSKVGITNTYASGNIIELPNTTSLVVNAPIIFTGTTDTANTGISANTIYYIKTISSPNITISSTGFDGTAGNALALGTSTVANMNSISYNGSTIWKRIDLAGLTGNDIVTGNLAVNYAASIGTTLTVTGNANVGNLNTAGSIIATGNISAGNINAGNLLTANYSTAILTTSAQPNITSVGTMNNITMGGANSIAGGNLVSANYFTGTLTTASQPNITSLGALSSLGVSGNANFSGNINVATSNVKMVGGTNGFFLQTDGAGNLTWTNGTVVAPASGAGGANTQIQFNDSGSPNGVSGFTFNKTTSNTSLPGALAVVGNISGANLIGPVAAGANTITTTGNANIGNLGTSGLIIATGNITGANLVTGGVLSATGNISTSANVLATSGYISVANGLYSTNTYAGSYVRGIVVDYSTGNGRITIGSADGLLIRNNGISSPATILGIDSNGNINATGSILSNSSSGIGYTTGAGSSVTQSSSRTTGVTINSVTGSITLVNAAGTSAYNTFTVTNNKVTATDIIIVNQKSGTDKYEVYITNVSSGSFSITFADMNGTTTEKPVFSFAVIKGVTA